MLRRGDMKKSTQNFLAIVVVGIGALVAAVLGLWGYMSATAVQLHPVAKDIQSVTDEEPRPEWAAAVTRAREIARDALSKQNLPGLSVAVAVGNDIVWAEGFGLADLENRI